MTNSVVDWYEAHANELESRYEDPSLTGLHDWFVDIIPEQPSLCLDIGAGTGRDAAWLASKGNEVVAVEPSAAMSTIGKRLHFHPRIRWESDRLPDLQNILKLNLSFDFILLSAVWMHLAPADRPRAFRKLIGLLKPGGFMAITLRHGPAEPERGIHPVALDEVEKLARSHGAIIERIVNAEDRLGRREVQWSQMVVRLPDDGTGALPLLRHIILNDAKSSTYKLALLRVVARIADSVSGMAWEDEDDHVAIPLGLAALFWVRAFKPLIEADLPQTPKNRGAQGLGFARKGFAALQPVSHLDLRIGVSFSGRTAYALHQALREAADTITRMPAHFMTYPNGGQIMKATRAGRIPASTVVTIDQPYLESFGKLRIPRNIWRALGRFNVWVEPALTAEWVRLMKGYARGQGRNLDDAAIAYAMSWADPARSVADASRRASDLIASGTPVYCVWSGSRLRKDGWDIDHCLPWSAWPCGDLWNLLPARRTINQVQKRDKLPSAAKLEKAQELIQNWWHSAYIIHGNKIISEQFYKEAKATLPSLPASEVPPPLEEVFRGVSWQRLRLKQDQQIPEWI
ncbi:class I SAM-dependent methyltransferase [Desulfoferula mesophila]|uniref:SAM-dependent methyltransferase n=1 Tax=Desulfoferula mesophila TaxID=3058419 RepID=A0AAU9EWB0_9BACT|nr:SAM-dependent methyltransferase [Desulfoferula mesophilus]